MKNLESKSPIRKINVFFRNVKKILTIDKKHKISNGVSGMIVLTTASMATAWCSWLFMRILPNRELVSALKTMTHQELFSWFANSHTLAAATTSSALEITQALPNQFPFIVIYALSSVFCFSFIIFLLSFLKNL